MCKLLVILFIIKMYARNNIFFKNTEVSIFVRCILTSYYTLAVIKYCGRKLLKEIEVAMRKGSKPDTIKAFKEGINYLIKICNNIILHHPKSKTT